MNNRTAKHRTIMALCCMFALMLATIGLSAPAATAATTENEHQSAAEQNCTADEPCPRRKEIILFAEISISLAGICRSRNDTPGLHKRTVIALDNVLNTRMIRIGAGRPQSIISSVVALFNDMAQGSIAVAVKSVNVQPPLNCRPQCPYISHGCQCVHLRIAYRRQKSLCGRT